MMYKHKPFMHSLRSSTTSGAPTGTPRTPSASTTPNGTPGALAGTPYEEAGSPSSTTPSNLLSRKQAAAYLGVAEQTLAIWKCTGRYSLPSIKIGRLVKYRKSDLDAFIQRGSSPN